MRYKALLAEGAEHDLEEIYNLSPEHDSLYPHLAGVRCLFGMATHPMIGQHPSLVLNELFIVG
jgi:hypothetical protein